MAMGRVDPTQGDGWVPKRKTGARATARRSPFPSPSREKGPEPITFAVADLHRPRLTGSERVFVALSLALAESMDAAPPYANGRLAHELREILVGQIALAAQQVSESRAQSRSIAASPSTFASRDKRLEPGSDTPQKRYRR
jgi:hypothetical protein